MDCSFGCFDHRLHKRVSRFLKDNGERNIHPVDAQIVFNHVGFNEIFACSGIAHCCQSVSDEFGVYLKHFNYYFTITYCISSGEMPNARVSE